jgi:hypothetical protein
MDTTILIQKDSNFLVKTFCPLSDDLYFKLRDFNSFLSEYFPNTRHKSPPWVLQFYDSYVTRW